MNKTTKYDKMFIDMIVSSTYYIVLTPRQMKELKKKAKGLGMLEKITEENGFYENAPLPFVV